MSKRQKAEWVRYLGATHQIKSMIGWRMPARFEAVRRDMARHVIGFGCAR
jgi:hypothetical protein